MDRPPEKFTPGRPKERLDERSVQEHLRTDAPANQGNNGLIFRVAVEGEGYAVEKLLKVYHPGEGRGEYEMQVRAHAALAAARAADPDKPFALIPEPGVFRDMRLDPETVEHLNRVGARLTGDHAEVIEMDFVDATDFATLAFREVVRRTDPDILATYGLRGGETADDLIRAMDLNALQDFVGRLLKLENPVRVDKQGNPYDDRAAMMRNSRRIFSFLASRGWRVHENLAVQLENTLSVVHAAGVWHNDVHERNVMIAGDPASPGAQGHLIDFGSASGRPRTAEGARDDEAMVHLLRESALTKDMRLDREAAEERRAYREEVERLRKLAPGHPRYEDFRTQFMGDHDRALSSLNANNERELSQSTLVLMGALDEKLISPDEARVVVSRMLGKSSQPAIRRKLKMLADIIAQM